jgi:Fur family ferric uptake transcriptional regulator
VGMVPDSTAAGTDLRSVGAGVRATRQRGAIIALLEKLDGFRSAQELHEDLRRSGANIGLTTVYRTLQALESANLVDMVRTDSGESVYRRCAAPHHHHHLVCRSCGAAVEVSGHEVEAWAAEVAAEHGFSDVDHTVELFGTCAGCRIS